ncbi:MAG: DUF4973 domain-containing protein [Bacteroidales bacterium]
MKIKYIRLIIALSAIVFCSSCNNEWEDELFQHYVSFTKNGVADVYVRYKPDGKVSYQLPLVVSGSNKNQKNLNVQVALGTDTLPILNFERFRKREDLYFMELDEQYYTIPEAVVNIPAGSCNGLLNIDFSLKDIDLVRNHVLPLIVAEGSNYLPNNRKHYRRAILNIIPFNDYSGTYSATNGYIYDRTRPDGEQTPLVMNTRITRVVDENSIFFYAGATDEDLQDRTVYKIVTKFIPDDEKNESGKLELSAPDASIDFQQKSATYKIVKEMDATIPYLEHTYITLNMEYWYDDVSNPQFPLHYKFVGSMTLERKRNILIPDEDQSFMW